MGDGPSDLSGLRRQHDDPQPRVVQIDLEALTFGRLFGFFVRVVPAWFLAVLLWAGVFGAGGALVSIVFCGGFTWLGQSLNAKFDQVAPE